ncbi:MAG: hypothetical protein IKD69_06010, partial [Solobacterium sp.]|nr:hypothetical protein [Solobacterium sp.]
MKDGVLVIDRNLTEEIYRGSFRIFKVRSVQNDSELASPEEGAVFTAVLKRYVDQYGTFEEALAHKDEFSEFEYDEITTDAEGVAESKQLVYGTYIVRQTGATAETQLLNEAFTFTVDSPHQKTIDYRIINRANPYRLRILKTDADTGEPVIWHAAEFKVFALTDSQGREVNAYVTQTIGSRTYDTFRTTALEPGSAEPGVLYAVDGENGAVTLPLEIEAGTYRIEEVKAPQGYRLLQEPIIVEIGQSAVSQADTDGTPLFTVTAENQRIKGSLQIRKTVTVPEADTILVNPDDLSGIVFTVFAAEDIRDAATGEVIVKKDEVYRTLTTGADGTANADKILPGRYQVRETQAFDGLLMDEESHEMVLEAGQSEQLEYHLEADNKVTLTYISKTDITGQKELPGARLQVSDDQGNLIDEWTSSDQPHRIAGLKAGAVYHLRETIAPDGYVRAEEISFTIAETGEAQMVQMKDQTVTMCKEDVYGKELPGAHMKVFDEDGNTVDEWVSGASAHMIKGLQEGKSYILHEDTAPAGYALAQDLPFTVTSEKKDQVLTVTDQMVTVSKQDVSGAEIEGALMRVYDSMGRIVDEWVSAKTPHAIENLVCGNSYVIHEELTPYVTEKDEEGNEIRVDLGYVKATDIPFTLQADGKN